MMSARGKNSLVDDEYCAIGDEAEIGFMDYENDKSVCNFDPHEEGPVRISVPFPFLQGKPQCILIGETSTCSITLENTTSEPVELWGIRIYYSNPAGLFTLSLMKPPSGNSEAKNSRGYSESFSIEDRVLQPHDTLTIWLSCRPKELGLHTSVVHFDVDDDRIERVVLLLAEDKVSQSMASGQPYSKTPRGKCFSTGKHVGSFRPAKSKGQEFKNRLPKYLIPKGVRELLKKDVPDVLREGLTRMNYCDFFSTLLMLEEMQMEKEMRCFNMECVTLKRKGHRFLALEVPGLAEKRPSLVHGDAIFVNLASESAGNSAVYKGHVHRVEADEVLLSFALEFHTHHQIGTLYNVRFTYNRVNMRRLYQAVEAAGRLEDNLLFPSQLTKRRLIKKDSFMPFTTGLNEEQMHSVMMILCCTGAPPYVIYGPPGTGKTMTLVEAILQIYATRKNARILVCAASNNAADHVLEKIVSNHAADIQENDIFRLNAATRPYEDVQPDYIRFCDFEESVFKCPQLEALLRYRIVISTYTSSSLLHAEGIERGHFSHIFLDEAGQASEPETMVPIANLSERDTVVVLAGDPKQLGPVIHSKDADAFGLGMSYLERLFECGFYRTGHEGFVTKLVRNYRCHPAILDLPSRLFYKGELLACKESRSFLEKSKLDLLPDKNFPVLFIGIQGCDEREGNNPSWFNRIEASKVVDVINKLKSSTNLNEADIGVIAPYRQQVLKIKNALEAREMPDVKVGSVEQFQGQEREVIVISTVRSTVKHNEFDKTYSLGFLSNPRRFNVAITRARSLLIIVGNPHIVCKDPYWDKLLRHCSDNDSYRGCPLPERQHHADIEKMQYNTMHEQLEKLAISK